MKNCKPYDKSSFDFYKMVYLKKQDNALKARLTAMDPLMQLHFDDYDQQFNANNLETLVANGYINQPKADLSELYRYDSATLSNLKTILTTTESGRVVKCQNCTINDVNTFDHLLPQSEFIEFIVHPLNLICSCGDCNGRKNAVWRNAGVRTSLNLYLDTLPDTQYLFASTDVGNLSTEIKFYLDNRDGIDATLFSLIESHYNRLNLFQRFVDGSDTVITSLRNSLDSLSLTDNPLLAKTIAFNFIRKEQAAHGINYWQSILKLALLEDDDFMIDYI